MNYTLSLSASNSPALSETYPNVNSPFDDTDLLTHQQNYLSKLS